MSEACGDGCGCQSVNTPPRAEDPHWRRWWSAHGPAFGGLSLFAAGLVWAGLAPGPAADGAMEGLGTWGPAVLWSLGYLVAGWGVWAAALGGLREGSWFDENFLMVAATLGALGLGFWAEAAAVMVFYRLGTWFEGQALARGRRHLAALTALRPDTARVEGPLGWELRPPETVQPGQRLQLRPGERVPVDLRILTGQASFDTAALTGEPLPRLGVPGEDIPSGWINLNGQITAEALRPAADSQFQRVLRLAEEAQERKSPVVRLLTRFARVYTPVVVGLALAIWAVLPFAVPDLGWDGSLYRALVLLTISCPCALVASIPLTYSVALGEAARRGLLIKGGQYLDGLARVDRLVLDKTGTLTLGRPVLQEALFAPGENPGALWGQAAALARGSAHPLSAALVEALPEAYRAKDFSPALFELHEEAGSGLQGRDAQGQTWRLGRHAWVAGSADNTAAQTLPAWAGVPLTAPGSDPNLAAPALPGPDLWLGRAGQVLARFTWTDPLRPGWPEALSAARGLGIVRTALLSGDGPEAVEAVRAALGLDEARARQSPADKLAWVEAALGDSEGARGPEAGRRSRRGGPSQGALAYLGDGLNDTPVLARADLGIAMGRGGREAALEAADVVLLHDEPAQLVSALRLGRKTRRLVLQNVVLALGFKAGMMALGAAGEADLWMAVIADVGVTLLAVLNALRAARA